MTYDVIDLMIPWRESAACIEVLDEVSFFPDRDDMAGIAKAKAICSACPVADACLSWAIETNQSEGIWGGHTASERRTLRRRWLEEIRRAS
jgi:WhiB family transcriptional regulator, redox-sensing transcriptional regulator